MTELTCMQFVTKLTESVKEYKKQILQTRDESAAAQYFDPKLKSFLVEYKPEIIVLSNINFDKAFMTFLKLYLYKK